MLCQPLPERSAQWHCKVFSGIHRVVKLIFSLCVCRPASLVCTEHLWITTRLLWRRRTSAARQTLSLQRYLRYVITLCTVGQRQASVWCCTAALDEWWQGSFQQSSQCKRAMQLFYRAADCFNCTVGQLLGINEGIFFFSPFPLVLSSQNLKVKSTKDCKDQLAKNSLESEYWVKWMARLHINQYCYK